jgi:hypothetical protein
VNQLLHEVKAESSSFSLIIKAFASSVKSSFAISVGSSLPISNFLQTSAIANFSPLNSYPLATSPSVILLSINPNLLSIKLNIRKNTTVVQNNTSSNNIWSRFQWTIHTFYNYSPSTLQNSKGLFYT